MAIEAPDRERLTAVLRSAATEGAAAQLSDALGSAVWLTLADAIAVGLLGDMLRALEPVPPVARLVPLADGELDVPRIVTADALVKLVPDISTLIRALGLTPQARAALNIELIAGPTPTERGGRHDHGYAEPTPIARRAPLSNRA